MSYQRFSPEFKDEAETLADGQPSQESAHCRLALHSEHLPKVIGKRIWVTLPSVSNLPGQQKAASHSSTRLHKRSATRTLALTRALPRELKGILRAIR
jgi:hypothetical protein